jgi:hypothetical protein
VFWATPQHMPDELLLTIPPACVVCETIRRAVDRGESASRGDAIRNV